MILKKVGELTERNALAMHDTNTHANPPFNYLTNETYTAMDFVKSLRAQGEKMLFHNGCRSKMLKFFCLEEDLERLNKNVLKKTIV